MSSKVFPPEDPAESGPMVWKRVDVQSRSARDAEPGAPEIEGLRVAWQQESERKAREAHAAGLRDGEAAGRSRAATEIQPILERLSRSIDEMAALRGRLRK